MNSHAKIELENNLKTTAKETCGKLIELRNKGTSKSKTVQLVYRRLSWESKNFLAILMVRFLLRRIERRNQRKIENEHFISRAARDAEIYERIKNNEKRETNEFDQIYENPKVLYGTRLEKKKHGSAYINGRERKNFRSWCKRTNKDFNEWFERAKAIAKLNSEEELETCESEWDPDGVMTYYAKKRQEKLNQAISQLVEKVKEETTLVVTEKLLKERFSLGDGKEVTWGSATIKDHQKRVDLLKQNIKGNAESAARHSYAIAMIKKKRAKNLGEVWTKSKRSTT